MPYIPAKLRKYIASGLLPVVLLLLCLEVKSTSRADDTGQKGADRKAVASEDDYLKGVRAFKAGDDEKAAEYLMEAARRDWRVRAVLSAPRWKDSLPEADLEEINGLRETNFGTHQASRFLYRLGTVRQKKARKTIKPIDDRAKGRIKKAGVYYFELIVKEHNNSPQADDAALALVESGLCVKNSKCPSCTSWAIRSYEKWLQAYSYSPDRDRVIKKLAGLYLELAGRLEVPAPWQSKQKAELCRGKALELASLLTDRQTNRGLREWAEKFSKDIRDSGKPYSTTPSSLLR